MWPRPSKEEDQVKRGGLGDTEALKQEVPYQRGYPELLPSYSHSLSRKVPGPSLTEASGKADLPGSRQWFRPFVGRIRQH